MDYAQSAPINRPVQEGSQSINSKADTIFKSITDLENRLDNLSDRLSQRPPRPVSGPSIAGNIEGAPPTALTLDRVASTLERCHSIVSGLQNAIG